MTKFDNSPAAQRIHTVARERFSTHLEYNYNDVADEVPDISRSTVSKWLHDLSADPQFGIRRTGPGIYMNVEPIVSPEDKVMTFYFIKTLVNGNDLVEKNGELFLVRKVPL